MNILALECSAGPVSAAIMSDGEIVSSAYSNIKITHSETLMSLVENVLNSARININDIDAFAVANGPGSFTGVRIGIAAIKGMAAPSKTPCIGVSTLFAMAFRFKTFSGIICPVMDARRNQVYNALFKAENGNITRLTDDRAISCDKLIEELSGYSEKIIVCGDGSHVITPFSEGNANIIFASGELLFQNATGVASVAYSMYLNQEYVSPVELTPSYLRLPQAERELNNKTKD